MKVQFQDQNLRVRIDEDELGRLLAGEAVGGHSVSGSVFELRYALALHEEEQPAITGPAADWRLSLPATPVRELAARLPSRDGLRFELPGTPAMEVLFDVDVRDSTRRRYPRSS